VDAVYGYNVVNTFSQPEWLDLLKTGGASIARAQFGWATAENYDSGVLALSTAQIAGLTKCAELGIKPCIVAGYGPPYKAVATLTVSQAVAVGQKVIPVTGSLDQVSVPLCHVQKSDNKQFVAEGMWGYYGALIHAVNVSGGIIELAAPTTVALAIGTQLKVNRLRYASINNTDPSNPAVQAYVRYVKFVAQQIADVGCEGYVCIWNEPPWKHDPWPARHKFYGLADGGAGNRLKGILTSCLTIDLPEGVSLVNGASDKSGANGITKQGVLTAASATAASLAIQFDGIHPYNDGPEGFGWNPAELDSGGYAPVETAFSTGNFRGLAKSQDDFRAANAFGPRLMATEMGTIQADEILQAKYLLRAVVAWWGMGVTPLIYSLSDGAWATAPDMIPRPAYNGLKRLAELVGRVEPGPGVSALPSVASWGYSDIYPMTVGLHGATGNGVFFAWLRTSSGQATGWPAVGSPYPRCLALNIPEGIEIVEVVNLRTGEGMASLPVVVAGVMTVPVDDDVLAMRFVNGGNLYSG
jgi:hypothetical protein